ncbi:MAG: hypothetical protein JST27_08875 [Bacteroidetes bacterium]|nr:hypothetical protein [Bacteroidota bacterium]
MNFLLSGSVALCLLACMSFPQESLAQKSKTATSTSADLSVTKTNVRRVPGNSPLDPLTEVSFEIIWHSKMPPGAIFFRNGKSEWLDCSPSKPERRSFGGGPNDFMLVYNTVRFNNFKPGDHLTLTADRHPHDVMPTEVRHLPADAIYYQFEHSKKWHFVKVKVPKLPPLQH